MLVEYKPFEPAFYATDIADWGMAYLYAKKPVRAPSVLVDTGHYYNATNIEQIAAWLLRRGHAFGGFHFNDCKSTPTTTSRLARSDAYSDLLHLPRNPFLRLTAAACRRSFGDRPKHNEKKVEAMIQTVVMAQELYAKASPVDHDALRTACRPKNSVIDAELILKKALLDVTLALARWRKANKLPADPLAEHWRSGWMSARHAGSKTSAGRAMASLAAAALRDA